ncbi:MAG: hypothetical protein KME32_28365 [Mojavia pulchra JT2-VF2]|jgi:hypothetical protein|uniref:Uncharacterized protein n=1 Tax=Mojavia pulchra JT2-VF2 TaxID=287848 RepID=A0A951Q3W6_9NOST|nr:hypothetical protein [Mojavia pulchra JT2-VF2]
MNWLLKILVRILPDAVVESLNAATLDELDQRGLIIWAEEVESDET